MILSQGECCCIMVDPKILVSLNVQAIEKQAEIYGPVFKRLVSEETARFIAEKLGEKPPKVDSLDEAIQYLTQNLDRYPNGHAVFAYSIAKAISRLEGTVGAGLKMYSISIIKPALSMIGLDKLVGHEPSTLKALEKSSKLMESLKVIEKGAVSFSGDDSHIDVKITGCDYGDACNKLIQEGVTRSAGEMGCGWGAVCSIAAEIITRTQHDYQMIRLEPPNCEVKVFKSLTVGGT